MKKHRLITAAGFVISIVLLYFSLRGIEYRQLAESIARADLTYALLPVCFIFVCLTLCSFRWSLIMGSKVRLRDAFIALVIGLFINNVMPARIGEVARGYAISKRRGIPFTYAVSTVFIDRVFDLLGLLSITFLFFPGQALPVSVSKALYALVAIFVVCVIVLFAVSREGTALKMARFLEGFKRPFLARLATRVLEIQENLRRISRPGHIALFIVLSIANWLSMSTALYFSLKTLGVSLPFAYVPFVCALLNFGLAVPSSPGYIGVYQFLLVYLLAIFGVPRAQSFAVSLFFHASWYIPYNIMGFIFIIKEHLHIKDIQRMEE
ncbi:MAG: lysylphosphatidylglycerol synthase transmembrane domain-containing protein [Syntrophorhabdaceae bacterium]|nr:lysylphosphatidylglycerol synthase transmembrane domain-containing protein [Syntrophorhabdaceae bacterium]